MVHIYENLDYLDLRQTLEYVKFLIGADLSEEILIQLINEKKIPCYVDAIGMESYLEACSQSFTLDVVVSTGRALLHDAVIDLNFSSDFYVVIGTLRGPVKIKNKSVELKDELWKLSDKNFTQSAEWFDEVIAFSLRHFHVKPADVKRFFLTRSPKKTKSNHGESPRNSALLMIAYFRDLLCHPNEHDKKTIRRSTNQAALITEIEAKFGVSESTLHKLFAEATAAAKDRI